MGRPTARSLRSSALIAALATSAWVCQGQTLPTNPGPPKVAPTPNMVTVSPSGAANPSPVTPAQQLIRIEPVAPFRLAADKPPWWSYWVPVVGPIVSGLLAFLGAWVGLNIAQRNTLRTVEVSQQTSSAAIWQKANETELRDIQEKLDKFYGPFTIRLKTDHQLAQDIRSRQPSGYRLLIQLFDASWLSGLSAGDRALVGMICEHGHILEQMIAEHAGSMEQELIEYFSRASAHFRILRLAYEGKLGDDPKPFTRYVYPKQLDSVLNLAMRRLNDRVAQLRANPGTAPGLIAELSIPDELRLPAWPDPDHRIDPRS